jgi:hypothetical protein
MRKSLIGLVAVTLVAFGASTANAVTAGWQILSTTGTAACDGNACTAEVGDTITIGNLVDNTGADAIVSLFTTMTFDQSVMDLTGGGSGAILEDSGFPAPILGVVSQPEQKFGEPAGDFIALAHASTTGATSAIGPDVASQLIFTVTGSTGSSNLVQFTGAGDESIINGIVNVPGDDPGLAFSDAILVTVPEPSTVLMSFASLGCLAAVVGVRRRRSC